MYILRVYIFQYFIRQVIYLASLFIKLSSKVTFFCHTHVPTSYMNEHIKTFSRDRLTSCSSRQAIDRMPRSKPTIKSYIGSPTDKLVKRQFVKRTVDTRDDFRKEKFSKRLLLAYASMDLEKKRPLAFTGQFLEKISRLLGINPSSHTGKSYALVIVLLFFLTSEISWHKVRIGHCDGHFVTKFMTTLQYILYILMVSTMLGTSLFRSKPFTFPCEEMSAIDSILE